MGEPRTHPTECYTEVMYYGAPSMRIPVHWARTQWFLVRVYIFMNICETPHGDFHRSLRHTLKKSEVFGKCVGVRPSRICTTVIVVPFEHWLYSLITDFQCMCLIRCGDT